MTELLKEYIDVCHDGKQSSAADALGVDKSTINKILAGSRNITPALAEKIEQDSGGRYKKEQLIWPEAA